MRALKLVSRDLDRRAAGLRDARLFQLEWSNLLVAIERRVVPLGIGFGLHFEKSDRLVARGNSWDLYDPSMDCATRF